MRIAIDCRSVFPGMGGIGRYAQGLVRALAELDDRNAYLLLFTTKKRDGKLVDKPNFREFYFEAAMIDERWEQLHLPTILADNEVDLYHATCFALPVVKTVKHQVTTVHDVVFRTHPELVAPRLRDYLHRWTEHSLEMADAVMTVSEFSRDEIAAAYGTPKERVHVTYNGIDRRFREGPARGVVRRMRARLDLDDGFVLYAGSLESKKNIDRLLEAFSLLVADGRAGKRQLVLAGGRGGMAYDVEAAVRRSGLADRVVIAGYVTDEEVLGLMHAADLFVYPSLYEGFGLPPLEAMACGTPTVVSNASCLPEVVGSGALLAPAKDAAGLADAMAKALHDKGIRKSLSQCGRKRAALYTWKRAAERTLKVYGMLAEAAA